MAHPTPPTRSLSPWLSIRPWGRFIYTANYLDSSVSGFRLDPNTGTLTVTQSTPYPAGAQATAIVAVPHGNHSVQSVTRNCIPNRKKKPSQPGWGFFLAPNNSAFLKTPRALGAPGLDFETWETTNSGCPILWRVFVFAPRVGQHDLSITSPSHPSDTPRKLLRRPQRSHSIPGRVELHGHSVPVVKLGQLAVDIGVVDLAGSRLMAARNVGHVDQPNRVDVLVQLLDQVALRHLLVEDVVEKLHLGMVHRADDLDRPPPPK